jgi:nucleoside-diphosphate-sugar epimerase
MKVFLTGGAGYVGSVLAPMLHEAGHRLFVLDRVCMADALPHGISIRQADLLDVRPDWLFGMDAVIHLAACSSDKSANADPSAAWRNNVSGSEHLISACLEAGVRRFILASTCSVYGWRPQVISDEASTPHPVGSYAESKYAVEVALRAASSSKFYPTILRKPTLFGWSPRMRTDVAVNSMLKSAVLTGVVTVHSPQVWRPILHVRDAASTYLRALEAPHEFADTYNVHFENYRLIDIAREVQRAMKARGSPVRIVIENHSMPLSYRVDSSKVRRCLQVHPRHNIGSGVQEMLEQASEKREWLMFDQTTSDRMMAGSEIAPNQRTA